MKLQKKYEIGQKVATREAYGDALAEFGADENIIVMDDATNRKGYHPATVKPEDMEKCVACASCAKICPDSIITVERD